MNSLKSYFIELRRISKETEAQLKKIQNAIKSGQEICEHDFKWIGNTHRDIYQCKICGKIDRI